MWKSSLSLALGSVSGVHTGEHAQWSPHTSGGAAQDCVVSPAHIEGGGVTVRAGCHRVRRVSLLSLIGLQLLYTGGAGRDAARATVHGRRRHGARAASGASGTGLRRKG